jgi:CO/xanthine dehydrogenase Mo-binding subunit
LTAVGDGNGGGRHLASTAVAVRVSGAVEGVAEDVDSVTLEMEPDVSVDSGGDADVGMAEKFLDHHQLVYEVRIDNARYQTYTDGLTDLPQFLYGVPNTRPAYRVTPVDVQSPCSMRGPGVVLGNFALETAMDQLAHELAVDPVELRLRNEPTRDEVPHGPADPPRGTTLTYLDDLARL